MQAVTILVALLRSGESQTGAKLAARDRNAFATLGKRIRKRHHVPIRNHS
jgi:hypothetical protein